MTVNAMLCYVVLWYGMVWSMDGWMDGRVEGGGVEGG